MQSGKIKWFNQSKAIGFIEHSDGRNILVRPDSLISHNLANFQLKAGLRVRYKIREAPQGAEAYEVEPCTERASSASREREL